MGTTLKWMLARASGQGDHTPLHPVLYLSYKSLFKGVKQSTNPSIFSLLPRLTARSQEDGDGMTD